jgi:hypothetical protein
VTARLRILLAVALVAVLVGGGSSVAWALWTTTGTAASSVTNGKLAAAISGTTAITTTFTVGAPSITRPVTLTNAGNIPGTTTTSAVVADGSTALAQAVDVVAWPVPTTDDCTDGAGADGGAVRGTWASLPSLTSSLAPRAAVVWCIRSTLAAGAPASATTNMHLVLTTTNASWVSSTVWGGFYLNSGDDLSTPTCTDPSQASNYVQLTWDPGTRSSDTVYAAFVGDQQVGDRQPGQYPHITLAPEQVTPSAQGAATVQVAVRALDAGGQPTDDVVGRTPVTLFTQDTGPKIRCGA